MNALKQFKQSVTKESFIQYFLGMPPFLSGLSESLRAIFFFLCLVSSPVIELAEDPLPGILLLMILLALSNKEFDKLEEIFLVMEGVLSTEVEVDDGGDSDVFGSGACLSSFAGVGSILLLLLGCLGDRRRANGDAETVSLFMVSKSEAESSDNSKSFGRLLKMDEILF